MNLFRNHFGLHQEQNVKATMEFKVPKRHISRPRLFIDMVQWILRWERQKRCSSRKRQGPIAEECCYNKILMIFYFFLGGVRVDEDKKEDKRIVKLEFIFKAAFFGHTHTHTYTQYKSTHSLFGARSFFLIHIRFTPSEEPKNCINWFFERIIPMKAGPSSRTIEKDHLPSVQHLHGPWYKSGPRSLMFSQVGTLKLASWSTKHKLHETKGNPHETDAHNLFPTTSAQKKMPDETSPGLQIHSN